MKKLFLFTQPTKYLSFLLILFLLWTCVSCEKKTSEQINPTKVDSGNLEVDYSGKYFQTRKMDFLDGFESSDFSVGEIAYNHDTFVISVSFFDVNSELKNTFLFILDDQGELIHQVDLNQLLGEDVQTFHTEIDETGYINIFFVSRLDGSDKVVLSSCKINKEAKMIGDQVDYLIDNIETSPDDFFVDETYIADDGKVYFLMTTAIDPVNKTLLIVFDENGMELFRVEDQPEEFDAWNFRYTLFSDGTNIYVTGINLSDNQEWYTKVLMTEKNIGEKEISPVPFGGYHIQSAEGVYLTDQTGIYWLSSPAGDQSRVLNWTDEGLDMTNSDPRSYVISEKKILVEVYHYGDGSASDSTFYLMDKKDNIPVDERQIIRLAGISIETDLIHQIVYEFNQKNPDFRVEIVEYGKGEAGIGYADYERGRRNLNLDILTNDVPDILYDSQNSINFYSLAHNHLFADLYEFMEKDAEYGLEHFYQNILAQGEIESRLCYMPVSFGIETLVGERSALKDINKWTYLEFETFADSFPAATKVISSQTYTRLLERILSASMYQFIDVRTNESLFDSTNFIDLLTFCKTYGVSEEHINSDTHFSELEMIKNNELVLFIENFNSVNEYAGISGLMDEPIHMVGYPSSATVSPVARVNESFAISSSSKHPDQAWEIIKNVISVSQQDALADNGYGLPIRKSSMEKAIEIAMKPPQDGSNGGGERIITDSGFSPVLSDENADYLRTVLSEISLTENFDWVILNIVIEESQAFFLGQKTAEDTAAVIQNRAQTRLRERKI